MAEPIETLSGDSSLELPEFEAPPADPLVLLERWLQQADERGVREPRALALATADAEGRPSSRILLLKQVTPPSSSPAATRAARDGSSPPTRGRRERSTGARPCSRSRSRAGCGS